MRIRHEGDRLRVHTPAKVNLFFEIRGRRTDGYHEIETLVYPVDLYDTLVFERNPGGQIDLTCRWAYPKATAGKAGFGNIPSDGRNLVVRAAELLQAHFGVRHGATIRLVKRIPAGAGLGGGSSDAAATLLALARLWQLPVDRPELVRLGAMLGSDVPLFLADGPAVCRGRGEDVHPLIGMPRLWLVIVRPNFGLSTTDVYRASEIADQPVAVDPFLTALRRSSVDTIGTRLFNRLEEAACRVDSRMMILLRDVQRGGAVAWRMTGSGSCCFGLCRHRRQALATARRLANRAGISRTFAVQGCS